MSNLVPSAWRESVGDLRDRITGIFDRWLPHRSEALPEKVREPWLAYLGTAALPAIDVEDTDDEIIVTAELPGLDEKDFSLELHDRRLVLRGEKKASREEKKRNYYYAESSYGSFYRTIPLPCEVNADNIRADYKRGILRVELPKTDEAKSKRIQVQVT